MIAATTLALAAVLWAGAKVGYPQWTRTRAARWDRSVERGPDGVRPKSRAFACGEGPTAYLMIHGFASSPAVFQCTAADLASRGATCRALRLPGFGEPPARMADVTCEDWRAAVDRDVADLRAQGKEIWLVGHSMGCALAIDYCLRHPAEPIAGVVLIAPLLEVSQRRSPFVPPRRWFDLGRRIWSPEVLVETSFPVDLQAPIPGLEEQRDLYMPMRTYEEMFKMVDAVRERAAEMDVPMLMVVAPADLVVDSAAAERYFDGWGSEEKQLVVFERSGHVIPLDQERHRLVEVMDRFARAAGAGRIAP